MKHTRQSYDELIPRHKALVDDAVGKYCDWLNANTDPDVHYDPEDFLDKSHNEYSDFELSFIRERKDYDRVYAELWLSDGDDGGPTMLFVHATRPYHMEETGRVKKGTWQEDWEVVKYNNPGPNEVRRRNPPLVHEFTYNETTVVWDDQYDIEVLIQEFDTQYNPFYTKGDQ